MNQWAVMGATFENLGDQLRDACENLETRCESDPVFDALAAVYAMMIDTLKSQIRFANYLFDRMDTAFSESASDDDTDKPQEAELSREADQLLIEAESLPCVCQGRAFYAIDDGGMCVCCGKPRSA